MTGNRNDKSRSEREIALRLIHSYQYHNPETGFNEWKPDTPQHVKGLQKEMLTADITTEV